MMEKIEYNLIEYGIYNEKSDIRAHVSNKVVYVFKTEKGIEAIENNNFPVTYAKQKGIEQPTARGYLVKPEYIEDIKILNFQDNEGWRSFNENWSTTKKGEWAVKCVINLLATGRFPLWIDAKQNSNVTLDIEGTDVLIVFNKRIQVKCDYRAYITGNLYIQTHESNPLKLF